MFFSVSVLCVLRVFVVKNPLSVAVLHLATTLPRHMQCRHNATHQNGPFSSLRAAALSVAALNTDDTTFSMSSNVIIFMVNLSPSLSGNPQKHSQQHQMRLSATIPFVAVCRTSSLIPHPFKCGECGGLHDNPCRSPSPSTVSSRGILSTPPTRGGLRCCLSYCMMHN